MTENLPERKDRIEEACIIAGVFGLGMLAVLFLYSLSRYGIIIFQFPASAYWHLLLILAGGYFFSVVIFLLTAGEKFKTAPLYEHAITGCITGIFIMGIHYFTSTTASPPSTEPLPVTVSSYAKADCSHGFFSKKHQCYADARIKNNGTSGNIDVTIVFHIESKEIGRKTKKQFFNAGEEIDIVFEQVSLSECPEGQNVTFDVLSTVP